MTKAKKAPAKNQDEPVSDAGLDEPIARPIDPIAAKAEQIRSFFPGAAQFEGVTLDPENPDHAIVAAFLVGSLGLLRR